MSSHSAMIMLIIVLAVTAGGVMILYDTQRQLVSTPSRIGQQSIAESAEVGDIEFVNVVANNVTTEGVRAVRFQVRYDGEGELSLNDTFIQLRTESSIADLRYRNGTLARDPVSGYYTE